MKVEQIKFDRREFEADRRRNWKQRLEWIDFWADYMKSKPNRVWSAEQRVLIDSQLVSARAWERPRR